jgi:hypothetical protein
MSVELNLTSLRRRYGGLRWTFRQSRNYGITITTEYRNYVVMHSLALMLMVTLELIALPVDVLAGLCSIAWDVMQIKRARREAQGAAAVQIQRAYRHHQSTRLQFGGWSVERTTQRIPLAGPSATPAMEQAP